IEQGNKRWLPLFQGRLAEIEAEAKAIDAALSRIEQALALADETGEHWTDAFLHRLRGEILLKRDPANTAPAEEAYLTAIAVARQQKARSFGLPARLSLAKLGAAPRCGPGEPVSAPPPRRRRARCARARPRRLFADTGISRDRRRTNAAGRA